MIEFQDMLLEVPQSSHLLAVGEPFIDFQFDDHTGDNYRSHRDQTRPLRVLLIPDQNDLPAAMAALKKTAAQDQRCFDTVAIVPAAPTDAPPCRCLIDAEQKLRTRIVGLDAILETHPIAGIFLDSALRIVDFGEGIHGAWLARALASVDHDAARTTAGTAPVLQLPRVFEPEFCSYLIEQWRRDHQEGGVSAMVRGEPANLANSSMKRRLDHKVPRPGPTYQSIVTRLQRRLSGSIFQLLSRERFQTEGFYLVRYGADRGDFFAAHRDNTLPTTEHPRFAITINLSDDFEGGGLVFPEFGTTAYSPPAGGAIVFSCSMLHAAQPVSQGERFAFLGFLVRPTQDR